GLLGIGLIVYGSILLSGRDFTGFLRINRGVLYALLSAFLFGVNVVIGKIAVVESNQFFFAWYYCLVMSFGLLPFVKRFPQKRELLNPLFPVIGFFFSAGMVTYTWAYLYTYASYVASLERTAILLDVLYGRLIFGEKVRNAFRASLMMLSGTVLLTL
ncbi:MAG: DMT family transporter, partial [Aquificae bacterium]|nr:DMT family transporter [Aquificota bacterium]